MGGDVGGAGIGRPYFRFLEIGACKAARSRNIHRVTLLAQRVAVCSSLTELN